MYDSQVAAKRLTFRAKLLLALRGGNRMTMSAFGTKRTSLVAPHMSAFGAKRTCRFALQMSAYDPKRSSFLLYRLSLL
jgi:hypothetical protein